MFVATCRPVLALRSRLYIDGKRELAYIAHFSTVVGNDVVPTTSLTSAPACLGGGIAYSSQKFKVLVCSPQ